MKRKVLQKLHSFTKYCLELTASIGITFMVMTPIVAIVALYVYKTMEVPIPAPPPKFFRFLFKPPTWIIIYKYFFVGCTEEAAFRYMLQDRLFIKMWKFKPWISLLLASVIFGAAHLANPAGIPWTIPQATGAAFAGAWFGYVYEKRGLHFAILTHGLYDALVVWMTWNL